LQVRRSIRLLGFATEISMVDLRKPDATVWSVELTLNDRFMSRDDLKKIHFDKDICLLGTVKQLKFIHTQTGKHLYTKSKSNCCTAISNTNLLSISEIKGLVDFAFNDEYLGVLTDEINLCFNFNSKQQLEEELAENLQDIFSGSLLDNYD
jgi:hypothetical protein